MTHPQRLAPVVARPGTAQRDRGTRWSALTQQNVDARVCAGVHFRFSDEVGATLGRRLGDYDVRRLADRARRRA